MPTAASAAAVLVPRQVVIVDSGSTDGTQAIVKGFPITLIQIKPEDFTYGYALNLGVANVDAEIVATLSAHSLPATARTSAGSAIWRSATRGSAMSRCTGPP